MSTIYVMDEESRTSPMKRVRCKDEDKELQTLLLANPALLPGDQIDPLAPRHWILIKREMPVTDPATGVARWSIDFLFADQFGIPTLVECKRCDDTRSRREVVAQMLEYAANGHHYWGAAALRAHAETTAGGPSQLLSLLRDLRPSGDEGIDDYFSLVQQNLRDAKMRLIFFLEESPNELRSLVEFMNRQMKDTEVLLVEARQYVHEGKRVVVPWLFGFTEEARVAKQESRAASMRAAGDKGEEAFYAALEGGDLSSDDRQTMKRFISDLAQETLSEKGRLAWLVNCIVVLDTLPSRGLFAIKRNGALELYFGYWDETKYLDVGSVQIRVRDQFAEAIQRITGLTVKKSGFPGIPPGKWLPKANELRIALQEIVKSV